MYDAIIYIYNQGLRDYVSPLQDLCNELREALDSKKQLSGMERHITLTYTCTSSEHGCMIKSMMCSSHYREGNLLQLTLYILWSRELTL